MESKNNWAVEEAELVSNPEGGPEEPLLADWGFFKEELDEIGDCQKKECYHKKKLIELQLEKDTIRERTEEELAKCHTTIEQMVKDVKNLKDTAEKENIKLIRKNHVLELENKALNEDLEEARIRDKSNFEQYLSAKKELNVKCNLLEGKLEEKQAELIGLRHCVNQAQIRIQVLERQIKDLNEESFGFQERMLQMKAQYEDDLQKIINQKM